MENPQTGKIIIPKSKKNPIIQITKLITIYIQGDFHSFKQRKRY